MVQCIVPSHYSPVCLPMVYGIGPKNLEKLRKKFKVSLFDIFEILIFFKGTFLTGHIYIKVRFAHWLSVAGKISSIGSVEKKIW